MAAIIQAVVAGTEPQFDEKDLTLPKFAETLPPELRTRFIRSRIYDNEAVARFKAELHPE